MLFVGYDLHPRMNKGVDWNDGRRRDCLHDNGYDYDYDYDDGYGYAEMILNLSSVHIAWIDYNSTRVRRNRLQK